MELNILNDLDEEPIIIPELDVILILLLYIYKYIYYFFLINQYLNYMKYSLIKNISRLKDTRKEDMK